MGSGMVCGISVRTIRLEFVMKYTYRCNICHFEFDKELSFKQIANAARPPKFKCPNCTGITRKIISKSAIHYKGSGFTLSKGEK